MRIHTEFKIKLGAICLLLGIIVFAYSQRTGVSERVPAEIMNHNK